ncbi:hypothetical protein L6452_31150 [Arctium lappa]|uniref:Uncharacterized protein n=1 Tax=Arctium lappa TaxID=4217 RepID=A0ACB8ZL46_ARCLA|nr:hypothetical protein L6452_31150 [Arctium lappa]
MAKEGDDTKQDFRDQICVGRDWRTKDDDVVAGRGRKRRGKEDDDVDSPTFDSSEDDDFGDVADQKASSGDILEDKLYDLNLLPNSENSSKDIIAKPYVEHSVEHVEDKQRTNMGSLVKSLVNGNEIGVAEVKYIEYENLDDLEDV